MKKILIASLCFLSLSLLGSCSSSEYTPPPGSDLPKGQCEVNENCPQNQRCNRQTGWCEDIYYPREKIKNY